MGKDSWPPGFRFHPTDEELILYYLKRKICRRKLKLDIIAEIDVYKVEPEELPGLSLLKKGDRQWFFFSPRDRKYPNGLRSNRSTRHGYWKATGKDRTITCNSRNVGVKKTLVFYRGRAPSGERTDWVMHEYTLDEEELRRCQNAQDYYAIYKLFKKSGPGPKNGEQYGAPFREEDWVDDDDCPEIISSGDQANQAQEVNNVLASDRCTNEQANVSLDDIDEVMNRIIADLPPQPADIYDFEQALSQFVGEEEAQSTMVHASLEEAIYSESCGAYPLGTQPNALEGNFDISQATTAGLQLWDVPEVTSTANRIELSQGVADDDFLEMDDLFSDHIPGPSEVVPSHFSSNNLLENSQLRQDDGLSEFDLFYDADPFVTDLLPSNQALPSSSCPESHCGGLIDQVGSDVQLYPNSIDAFGNELWSYANTYMPTTSELHEEPILQPMTGVVYGGNSTSICSEPNQNQSGKEVEGVQPWLSSTLWSFVESIPAAPASAAESALVSKTFQRISSFSRARINAQSISTTANRITVSPRASGRSRLKGLFILSFLVAIFAVVCVVIGSNVSVLGKVHRRMNL